MFAGSDIVVWLNRASPGARRLIGTGIGEPALGDFHAAPSVFPRLSIASAPSGGLGGGHGECALRRLARELDGARRRSRFLESHRRPIPRHAGGSNKVANEIKGELRRGDNFIR